MTNEEMALSYIDQARYRLGEVERAFADGRWAIVVRRSQECVEQSLKAALRFVGIEHPKWHDVGDILVRNADRFPHWFRREVERLRLISRRRKEHRELSFYGDEMAGITPEELYDEEDARQALEDARFVHGLCSRLILMEPSW